MSHSIKISDEVLDDLRSLQRPRETYNELINRLLNVFKLMEQVKPFLDRYHEELKQKVEKIEKEALAHGPGDQPEVPDVPVH